VDEAVVRRHADEHAKSVERGDLAAVTSDFVPEMHAAVPEIAKELPQPTKTAEVLKVEAHEDHALVEIRYSGDDKSVTIRSRWEDRGGRPLIVSGEPVG
jgi:hypothetical protein